MRQFENRRFGWIRDQSIFPWQRGRVFSDLEFRRCSFDNVDLSQTPDPRRRSCIRNVRLVGCESGGIDLGTAVIEDCLVDGLVAHQLPWLGCHGAVFRHVVLQGRISQVFFHWVLNHRTDQRQRVLDAANADYYKEVDWALDISRAEFKDSDFRGVPGHLVRRDPATQVLVRRERAVQVRWQDLGLRDSYGARIMDVWLADHLGYDSLVLAAPKWARDYKRQLAALLELREVGIAEPDDDLLGRRPAPEVLPPPSTGPAEPRTGPSLPREQRGEADVQPRWEAIPRDQRLGLRAFVCVHIARQGEPILGAIHDVREDSSDSGWAFICERMHHDPDEWLETRFGDILASDPSVEGIADMEEGWWCHRHLPDTRWRPEVL